MSWVAAAQPPAAPNTLCITTKPAGQGRRGVSPRQRRTVQAEYGSADPCMVKKIDFYPCCDNLMLVIEDTNYSEDFGGRIF